MKTWLTQHTPISFRGISGAAVGLFLARVALESTRRPWPALIIITVALMAALTGFFLSRRLTPSSPSLAAHHLPLVAYIFWPRSVPQAAAGAALLAALFWILGRAPSSFSRWTEPLADGAALTIALILYNITAAPDVLPADAGEFQWIAPLLGVAHPPGYPLYMLAGGLFTRLLPWGTPAFRLNLLSGLLAASTLALTSRATRLWAIRLGASSLTALIGGLAAALTLGTATVFWAQATIANVRTPAVFFAALALYALARLAAAKERKRTDRNLLLLALALGLGGGHYPPLAFVAIFFLVYVLLTHPRLIVQPRRWLRPLLVGLAAFLLPLVYLPVRGMMGAPQASADLATLPGFLHHFLARGFTGDMFAFANAADLPHRLALAPTLFSLQFNTILLAAALLGLLGLIWRDWRLFILLAGSLVIHTFASLTYRAPQTVEYLMPAYLPIAIAVGLLPTLINIGRRTSDVGHRTSDIGHRTPTPLSLFCAAAIFWGGILNGCAHAPSFIELAHDHTARQTTEPLLEQAPADALILADWRWYTPLTYLQEIEGLRPDVEVRYVYNVGGEEYWDTWERQVREASPARPLLLTHFYEFSGYITEPWETGFRIRPEPVTEPVAHLMPLDATFGDQMQVMGYSFRQNQFHPGQIVEFTLAWRATDPLTSVPSFTLALLDPKGRRVAQADQLLPADLAPGKVHFERLALPFYPTLSPGQYRLTLGAYTTTDAGFETLPTSDGADAVTLTKLELNPLSSSPFTLHPQATSFDGGPTLVGVDYDRSLSDALRLYLRWRGPVVDGVRAQVRVAGGAEAIAPLPPIPADAYQTIALDLPGVTEDTLWVSLLDEPGRAKTAAGPWAWPKNEVRLPTPAPDAHFVPLGDEMAVIGAKAHPAPPGETMALDVTLAALRPLTTDDAISVRLMNSKGRWIARHDMQPALGAIPTLKWIRGSQVMDRHLLHIPEDFTGVEVHAALVAYERFRMTSLIPLDRRFIEVPLGHWPIPQNTKRK